MKTKLVVHIGQGKTGSTAIQTALRSNQDALLAQGVHYLGHLLENAQNVPKLPWQHVVGSEMLLHQMPEDVAKADIIAVLTEELTRLSDLGAPFAIWSNEALFERRFAVGPALATLREAGWPVQVVLYIRRHDGWAQSAYAQWGIKHKAYSGPVKPFREWIADRPVRLGNRLDFWDGLLDDDLEIINFNEITDAAGDFFARLGIEDIQTHRAYETPSAEVLAAWAVYNSRFEQPMAPESFMRFLNAANLLHQPAPKVPCPSDLLPTTEDLAAVLEDAAEDIGETNAYLADRGQPIFDTSEAIKAKQPPTEWDTTKLLLAMLSSQQEQLTRLRKRVDKLQGS